MVKTGLLARLIDIYVVDNGRIEEEYTPNNC